MTPNLESAAIKAAETLIKYRVSFAPVTPLSILKRIPGVLVVPFAEMAQRIGIERDCMISTFGASNQDAVTNVLDTNGRIKYLVTYNQRLPYYMQQRALARELGHIILGHDGTRPDEVRTAEALVFARHFICPRPLVRTLQESGLPVTVEVLGNVTGCYERCLMGMRKTPGVHVPAELNRAIKEQFADYAANFLACHAVLFDGDESALADFGSFMDGYED